MGWRRREGGGGRKSLLMPRHQCMLYQREGELESGLERRRVRKWIREKASQKVDLNVLSTAQSPTDKQGEGGEGE